MKNSNVLKGKVKILAVIFALATGLVIANPSAESSFETLKLEYSAATGVEKAELALRLAERINLHDTANKPEEFIELLKEAEKASLATGDSSFQIKVLFNAGKLAWQNELLDSANEYYEQALVLAQKEKSNEISIIGFYLSIIYFEASELNKAAELLTACVENTTRLKNLKLLPRCSNLLANIYNKQGRPTDAIPLLNQALYIETNAKNTRALAAITNNLGLSYSKIGAPDKAIEFYFRSLDIEQQQGNLVGKIISLMNISTIYFHDLKEVEAGFKFLDRAIYLAEENKITRSLPLLYVNKASFYRDEELFAKAKNMYLKALDAAKVSNDLQTEVRARLGLGRIAWSEEKFELALEQYRSALKNATILNSEEERIIASIGISEALNGQNKSSEALNYLKPALESALKNKLIDQTGSALRALSVTYAQLQDFKSAYYYLGRYNTHLDQRNDENIKTSVAKIKTKYETEKKEIEIALLKKDNALKDLARKKDEKIKNWLISFVVVFTLMSLIIFNRYYALQKTKKIISKKNKEFTRVNEQLKVMSLTDTLTQLSNRRAMDLFLQDEVVRFERNKEVFSIVIMDIDAFKNVNEQHGHDCGDFLLAEISQLLRSTIRKQDRICRWGGEEFLLLLPNTGRDGSVILSERLRVKIENSKFKFKEKQTELSITMTMGIATYDSLEKTIKNVIKKADENLYIGKTNGRNQVN